MSMIDDNDIIELTKVKNKLDAMIEKVSNIPKVDENELVKQILTTKLLNISDNNAYIDLMCFMCTAGYYDINTFPKSDNNVDAKILCKLMLNGTINSDQLKNALLLKDSNKNIKRFNTKFG